ncbi:MAG: cytochrome c oxidase subunit I, partial [Planctomycetota bacterium]
TYDPSIYEYNEVNFALRLPITILAFILFTGQLIFLTNFFVSAFKGKKAGENPWEATTLEWSTPSPAPHGNFGETEPAVYRGAYEYSPEDETDKDFLPQWRES